MVALAELAAASGEPDRRPRRRPTTWPCCSSRAARTADPEGRHAARTARSWPTSTAWSTAAEVDLDREVIVSWLPLYHDMGLIGLLTIPMITGIDLVLGSPAGLHGRAGPLGGVDEPTTAGTATAGPNFSYALAARALSRLVGPRPVAVAHRPQRRRAGRPGDRPGLRRRRRAPTACDPGPAFPAFGMAEVAIAGTLPRARAPGFGSTSSTAGPSRPSATRRRPAPSGGQPARWPCSAGPSPASRSGSATLRPASRSATGRWASCRSAAPR